MRQRLKGLIASGKHWHLIVAGCAALAVVMIMWTGHAAWVRSCRVAPAGISLESTCPSLIEDLAPLSVSLGFAVAGLIAWFVGQAGWGAVFFLMVSSTMTVGMLTNIESDVNQAGPWFYGLLAWLAPVTLRFHHSLLDRSPRRMGRFLLVFLHVYAIAATLPFLVWTVTALQESGSFPILRTIVRLTLVLTLGASWVLILREYRRTVSPMVRSRIRLVTFGALFAFVPLVLLSLVPDTLGISDHVPFEATFPFLLLSPFCYLYSIFRHRQTRSDIVFSRAAVYYLSITLLLSGFLIAVALLNRLVTTVTSHWPVVSAALSLTLILLFTPLKRGLERLLIWILYGSEIAYASIISQFAESLAMTLDRDTLHRLLMEEFPALMRLSGVALLLRDPEEDLILFAVAGGDGELGEFRQLSGNGPLAAFLRNSDHPFSRDQLRRETRKLSLSTDERRWIALSAWSYWLPFVSGNILQGLALIARQADEDYFTQEEENILATVAHQSAIAIHNLYLMEEIHASRQELASAHRRLLLGRERDQRHLARELHDGALQNLIGVMYQIAEQRRVLDNGHTIDDQREGLDAIRQRIAVVVNQLRGAIGELRPAGLQELGLHLTLESYAERLEQEGGTGAPGIELEFEGNVASVPESLALCLFRVAQEALRNAVKHSRADLVQLKLDVRDHVVELEVRDDGKGFRIPARLSELTHNNHFGVVGMREWVESAGGQFKIESALGAGTRVYVQILMDGSNAEDNSGIVSR